MFRSRTLFIIGAGASSEIGLPIGTELTKIIGPMLDIGFKTPFEQSSGDRDIVGALNAYVGAGRDINPYIQTAREISRGMPLANSIDSYIDVHQHDKRVRLCGKLAIVKSIMQAEWNSKLSSEPERLAEAPTFDRIANTWFVKFFRILHEGTTKSGLDSLFNNVAIINFNYDRCVEQFLFDGIRALYAVDKHTAGLATARLRIHHPYGTIGSLPWQDASEPLDYGSSQGNLLALSQRIRTYTERVEEGETLAAIRQEVAKAGIIVFLGFGFNKQNLQLITPEGPKDEDRAPGPVSVYATGLGMSDSDRIVVANVLHAMLAPAFGPREVFISNVSCTNLFDEYWRTLSAW